MFSKLLLSSLRFDLCEIIFFWYLLLCFHGFLMFCMGPKPIAQSSVTENCRPSYLTTDCFGLLRMGPIVLEHANYLYSTGLEKIIETKKYTGYICRCIWQKKLHLQKKNVDPERFSTYNIHTLIRQLTG